MNYLKIVLFTAIFTCYALQAAVIERTQVIPNKQVLNDLTFSANNISFNYLNNILIATNNVIIAGSNINITADSVYYDTKNKLIIAKGNVVYKNSANDYISLDYLELDHETSTFLMENIYALFEGGATMVANKMTKSTPEYYKVMDLSYTACKVNDNTSPTWDVVASSGKYHDNNNTVTLYNVFFRIKTIPVLWFPVFQLSNIDNKRKAGFLIPTIYFNSKLTKLIVPFYIPINESNDATLNTHLYTSNISESKLSKPLFNLIYNGYVGNSVVKSNLSFLDNAKLINPRNPEPQKKWSAFFYSTLYVNDVYRTTFSLENTNSINYLNNYNINPKQSSDRFLNNTTEHEVFLEDNYFNVSASNYQNIDNRTDYNNVYIEHSYFNNNFMGNFNANTNIGNFYYDTNNINRVTNIINYNNTVNTSYGILKQNAILQSVYNENANDTLEKNQYYSAAGASTSYSIPFTYNLNDTIFLTLPTTQLSYSKMFLSNRYTGLIDANTLLYTKNNLFFINHYQGEDSFEQTTSFKYGLDNKINNYDGDSASLFFGQLINLTNNDKKFNNTQIERSNYFSSLSTSTNNINTNFEGLFDINFKLLSSISSVNFSYKTTNIGFSHLFYQNLNKEVFGVSTQQEINVYSNLTIFKNTVIGAKASYGIYTKSQAIENNKKELELKELSYFLQWQDSCGCLFVNFGVSHDVYKNIPSSYSLSVRLKKF